MNIHKRETLPRAARIGLVIVMVCSLFAAFPATPVHAESYVLVVGPDEQYSTIQAAVNNARPNTVIHVKAGTYDGSVDLSIMGFLLSTGTRTGNLAIVSIDGPGEAVLNGGYDITLSDKGAGFDGSLWLDGMTLSSNYDSIISLQSFKNLMLTNCTITASGDSSNLDSHVISLKATSGVHTVAIKESTFNNFARDGINVAASGSARVDVVVEDSIFKAENAIYSPQKAIAISAIDTSTAQLTAFNNDITGMFNSAISVVANSASKVNLSVHVYKNRLTNVARSAGKSAIEVKTAGTGAHDVEARIVSNEKIDVPTNSKGILLEPGGSGTFTGVMRWNTIDGGGIVVDSGTSQNAATTGKFKMDTNLIRNTYKSSAIDMHLRTNQTVAWFGLISNNILSSIVPPDDQGLETMHFKVERLGGSPSYTMNLSGSQGNGNIKVENNNTGGIFNVIGEEASASAQISRNNPGYVPYVYGTVSVTPNFTALIHENTRPVTNPDRLITWKNMPRSRDVVDNDVDTNGKILTFANPLGKNGGSFYIDTLDTPDFQQDDLLVYQPQKGYLDVDSSYYVMQDNMGCMSIGKVDTFVTKTPVFLPAVRK